MPPWPSGFKPLAAVAPREEAATAEERIAKAIEEDIVFGRLLPGAPLREEKLEERFGHSRHVIRAALGRLERIGIVTK